MKILWNIAKLCHIAPPCSVLWTCFMAQLLNMFLLCKGGGSMGVLMPIYTVAIIVFFVYTTMKVIEKLLRLPYHTRRINTEEKVKVVAAIVGGHT